LAAKALLQSLGYTVMTATNGREAVDICRNHQASIDLVLLDMIMPEMSGRDAFAAMRAINPAVRVVLASGFAHDEDVAAMKQTGLLGFIKKPMGKRP
jgi:CheY-like chemotaxis protein